MANNSNAVLPGTAQRSCRAGSSASAANTTTTRTPYRNANTAFRCQQNTRYLDEAWGGPHWFPAPQFMKDSRMTTEPGKLNSTHLSYLSAITKIAKLNNVDLMSLYQPGGVLYEAMLKGSGKGYPVWTTLTTKEALRMIKSRYPNSSANHAGNESEDDGTSEQEESGNAGIDMDDDLESATTQRTTSQPLEEVRVQDARDEQKRSILSRTTSEVVDELDIAAAQSKKSEASSDLSGVETLDAEGDVILAFKSPESDLPEKYLASSRVLSLASPIFSKLLRGAFSQSDDSRNGATTCLTLEGDNSEAMATILRIIHFRRDSMPFDLAPLALAQIAILCDKYNVTDSLEAWIQIWTSATKLGDFITYTTEDIGLVLVAGHMFRRGELWLSNLASKAMKYLKPDFVSVWEKQELLGVLPEKLAVRMSGHISQNLRHLQDALLGVDEYLRQNRGGYLMPGSRVCRPCGLTFGAQVTTCWCGKSLVERYCTVESRVSEYFALLGRFGLYPPVRPFGTCSLHEIDSKIRDVLDGHGHDCEGGLQCPLKAALSKLWNESKDISAAADFAWTRDVTDLTAAQ